MKKLFAFLMAMALLVVNVKPVGAITGGEPDTTHDNVGALLLTYPGLGPLYWCSGTLVAPQVFLTAGHCLDVFLDFIQGTPEVYLQVTFEENVFAGTAYEVSTTYIHPGYIDHPDKLIPPHRSNNYDLAAVILTEPVAGITPATLPEVGFLDMLKAQGQLREGSKGTMFTVVGYGAYLDFPPPIQNIDGTRRSARSEFLSLLNARLHTSSNQATDSGGTCFMDSGGPAFWVAPDESEILVGVLMWASNCVASQVHYRLDTADSLAFIYGVMEANP